MWNVRIYFLNQNKKEFSENIPVVNKCVLIIEIDKKCGIEIELI